MKSIRKEYTGYVEYRNENDRLHREDGPAVEYSNGGKHWFINGKRHRIDGPAVEYCNGATEWWLNGKLHREDGPAIEYSNSRKFYLLNGEVYSYEKWDRLRKMLWLL